MYAAKVALNIPTDTGVANFETSQMTITFQKLKIITGLIKPSKKKILHIFHENTRLK